MVRMGLTRGGVKTNMRVGLTKDGVRTKGCVSEHGVDVFNNTKGNKIMSYIKLNNLPQELTRVRSARLNLIALLKSGKEQPHHG